MRRLASLSSDRRRSISTVRCLSSSSQQPPPSKTLAVLIRHGHLQRAQQLFDSLPSPDTSSYTTLISGHVKRRDLPRARHLFDVMPQRDVASYNAMLSGYALSNVAEELQLGRDLFDEMPVKDCISWNTMINGYVRNGRMKDAMQLFDDMPCRDVVTWNSVINGFFASGDAKTAMEMFERMPVRDAGSLSTVVSGLVKNGRLEEAEEILLRSGSEIEKLVDAYNTLIAAFARRGMVEQARTLFYLIPKWSSRFKKNVVSWNTMIMCYVKCGDLGSARALFDEMPHRDLVSWNTMINGYVHAREMDKAVELFDKLQQPDSWSWNAILCGLTRNGDLKWAEEIFDRMPCKTLVSWNALLSGYVMNKEYEGAMELFARMQAFGEQPDKHSLSSLLSACAGLASLRLGIQIHQLVKKMIVSDVAISNALITMYSQCRAVVQAKAAFVETAMHARDVISLNAMIGGLAAHGHAKEALELFQLMKNMNVKPTHITYISVLHACSHAGLVDEGKREFSSLVRDFCLKPRVEHHATLVGLIGRRGQLEEALEVIEGMDVEPSKEVWGALLSSASVHNNVRVAEMAADKLTKAEPESSLPYAVLSNFHADEGRWSDALRVREVMNKSGIVKQPAYSWIEVDNRVHRFLSGDMSRPLWFEIFSTVETCTRVSREIHLTC